MRVHEQTTNRAPKCAWFWLLLVAILVPGPSLGQTSGPDPSAISADDPVRLSAEAVWSWTAEQDHWAYMRGKVAVIQGIHGIRADQAVVRFRRGKTDGVADCRVEVYAENNVRIIGRPGPSRGTIRLSLRTENAVKLTPYQDNGLVALKAPPSSLPILARALSHFRPQRTVSDRNLGKSALPVQETAIVRLQSPVAPPSAQPLPLAASPNAQPPPADPALVPAQFQGEGFSADPSNPSSDNMPSTDAPPIEEAPVVPNLTAPSGDDSTLPEPLPGPDGGPAAPSRGGKPAARPPAGPPTIPIMPGTQRTTRIFSRTGGPEFKFEALPDADGYRITMIRGGVTIVTDSPAPNGTVDISADSMIMWRPIDAEKTRPLGPNGEVVEDVNQPMEVYLEGNVVFRQDSRTVAGNGDQKTIRANQAYYDFRSGRMVALEAEFNMFAPGLIAPTKMYAPRIDQFRPIESGPKGKLIYGLEQIQANTTMMTGSRFPKPGYRFNSQTMDLSHVVSTKANPNSGTSAAKANPNDPNAPKDLTWRIDARQNVYYMGPVPIFYWPRILCDADDFEPPLRQLRYGYNNYLGQQILTDFNGFRLLGIRRPQWVDMWTIDLDYMSERTKEFPALGSELGWFGRDFLADLSDPYRNQPRNPDVSPDGYYGYLDMWGLKDYGVDDLGTGPAIVTPTPNFLLPDGTPVGKAGIQRGPTGITGLPDGTPPFQQFRGRINFRHMQSLLGPDADDYEDLRVQVEAAYVSDRYFLEEYYKRLNETGLDQETLAYLIRQKQNWAWSVWTEANLQNFNTDTQWLPKVDYFRLGDSLLGNRLTYFEHSGADWANTHTAVEVNNPNIFAFMPYDPISNTSGSLRTGRVYTNHEVDLPLNFNNVVRVIPYVQGQAVAWNNQLSGNSLGRIWGAAGVRADVMVWKLYPGVESELFNVHGLNHKVTFEADYRDAYSDVKLDQIGIQDDLDDNDYEGVRRYFALVEYLGGVLPPQYDPRHLILRRAISPITGTTDVQASMETLQLNLHSRLQTKRGPIGRRRVIDYMTLDVNSTYFPYARRDNFGTPFGQNMYNWQWFIGDRTSIISYGWFEFFNIGGMPLNKVTQLPGYPFGLNVVTSGISINRPPRAQVFLGYTVLNSGPLITSAFNPTVSYWLSPKWYATFSTSYDFGNMIWLASMFSFTRVGADYLTTFGWVVDPQRQNFNQLSIAISPRISPGIRFGSGGGLTQFDSRYAPTQ